MPDQYPSLALTHGILFLRHGLPLKPKESHYGRKAWREIAHRKVADKDREHRILYHWKFV